MLAAAAALNRSSGTYFLLVPALNIRPKQAVLSSFTGSSHEKNSTTTQVEISIFHISSPSPQSMLTVPDAVASHPNLTSTPIK